MAIVKKTTTKKAPKTEKSVEKKSSTGVLSASNAFIVKQPWITEKSYNASLNGQYVFLVNKNSNKPEIKKAIEALYKVNVIEVNTIKSRGKNKHFGPRITKGTEYKKAIVTLKKGQTIDVMPT